MKAQHFRLTLAVGIALACVSAYAGILPADALAGLGMLGIIGNTEAPQILEALKKATEDMRGYVDRQVDEVRKSGAATEETKAAIEKANADITELRKQLDEAVKASQRPATGEGGKPADPDKEHRKSAFTKLLRYGAGESGRALMSPEEVRALSSASDGQGGFLVPTDFETGLITQAFDEAEIRPVANVAPTSRDRVFLPAMAQPTVAWGILNVDVAAQDVGVGGENIQIHDLTALVCIHNNTLEDSDADIWGELQMQFSSALAEAEDDAFATGAGALNPQGVMAHSGVVTRAKNSGVAAALFDATHNGVDVLIQALYGLKKTYRRNATWAFNSTTESVIRTLKDGNDNYLWQPPVQAGAPALLLGRPIINPEGMPDIAANSLPIVVGDFRKGYKIRDRRGISVQRLVERFAEKRQTGFLVTKRVGGQCVLAEAFTPVKIAA